MRGARRVFNKRCTPHQGKPSIHPCIPTSIDPRIDGYCLSFRGVQIALGTSHEVLRWRLAPGPRVGVGISSITSSVSQLLRTISVSQLELCRTACCLRLTVLYSYGVGEKIDLCRPPTYSAQNCICQDTSYFILRTEYSDEARTNTSIRPGYTRIFRMGHGLYSVLRTNLHCACSSLLHPFISYFVYGVDAGIRLLQAPAGQAPSACSRRFWIRPPNASHTMALG